jgi:hypothetical protein
MNFVYGELHDPLCSTYQTLEIARLNDALKEAGITDKGVRRKVCEIYFFNAGYFVDSCWFSEKGRRFRPGVCFTEIDNQGRETERTFLADPHFGTALHEYVHGALAWLFDDRHEDVSEIEAGDVQQLGIEK